VPQPPALATELGVSFAWKGRYPRKGLGVFGCNGWRLEPAEEPTPVPWVLPLRVFDPTGAEACLLLATWTVAGGQVFFVPPAAGAGEPRLASPPA